MKPIQMILPLAVFILLALGYACSSDKKGEEPASRKEAPDTAAAETDLAAREEPEVEAPATEGSEEVGVPFEMTESGTDEGGKEPDVVPPVQPGEETGESKESPAVAEEEPAPEPEPAPRPGDSGIRVSVPEGPVRVEPTKADLAYVGVDKCKVCHKIQYASWLESKHASLAPPLDCESCHGPGSGYRSLTVMKDPAAAREAGLVIPEAAFCKTCHVGGWSDAMLKKAHAHKEVPE